MVRWKKKTRRHQPRRPPALPLKCHACWMHLTIIPCASIFSRRSKDYRKVPIASYQDQVWKGSDVITDQILSLESVQAKLQAKWQGSDMTLEDFRRDDAEWIAWTNDRLASLLYPNICRTLGDSYTAFAYVEKVPHFGFWQRQSIRALGSVAMYLAASRVKSKYECVKQQGGRGTTRRLTFLYAFCHCRPQNALQSKTSRLPSKQSWWIWKSASGRRKPFYREAPSHTWGIWLCTAPCGPLKDCRRTIASLSRTDP